MKKTILILVFTLVFGLIYAQSPAGADPTQDAAPAYHNNSTFGLRLGLNTTIEYGTYITPSLGFSYEWVPKWSGIEIGAYYTNYRSVTNGVFASMHHIQIPIMWKVHTKHVNIALGLQTVWYLGYSIHESKSTPDFESAKRENYSLYGSYISEPMAIDIGAALRVGFPVRLSSRWSFEPFIGMEYMYEHSFAASVGVAFRVN